MAALSDVASIMPWRTVQLIAGASALLALPVLWMMREPARLESDEVGRSPLRSSLATLWANRRLLIPMLIAQITVTMVDAASTIWAVPVLTRNYHLQPADFSSWMSLVMLSSGLAGVVVGGFAADIGHRSKLKGGILIGAVLACDVSIPASFFAVMPTVTGFAIALGVLMLGAAVTGMVLIAAIAILLPNEVRGLCMSLFVIVGVISGFGVAPMLVAMGSDFLGGEAHLGMTLVISGVLSSSVALAALAYAMLGKSTTTA